MRVLIAIAALATGCTTFEVADGEVGPDASLRIVSAGSQPGVEIPDDTDVGITDAVEIADPCAVDSVEIDVEILHPWRGDLFMVITGPSGNSAILKNYVDEDGVDDLVGTFPDTLLPVQSLDVFAGEDGDGPWALKVSDLGEDDVGTFESWAIHLACR